MPFDSQWALAASLDPDKVVKVIRRSLRATGKLVAEQASIGSPVDTGDMRDGWISSLKNGNEVFVRNKVKYVRHVPHVTSGVNIEIAVGSTNLVEAIQKELLRGVKKPRRSRKKKTPTPARG